MKNKGYQYFVDTLIEKEPIDTPIYTKNVAEKVATEFNLPIDKARAYTNVALKRNLERGNTKRFMKGIYYKPKMGLFRELPLNTYDIVYDALMKKENQTVGYITGPDLINVVGLSTQIPRERWIATNNYNMRFPYKANIRVVKPATTITDKNIRYLQALDLIRYSDEGYVDASNPQAIICSFIKERNLDSGYLLFLANKFYDQTTIRQAINILFGERSQYESAL